METGLHWSLSLKVKPKLPPIANYSLSLASIARMESWESNIKD